MESQQILMKDKKGFTLIEILIVVGIITLLAAAVVVLISPAKRFEEAREKQIEIHLQAILSAIEQKKTVEGGWFGVNCSSLPSSTTTDDEGDIAPDFKVIGTATDTEETYYDLFSCLVPKYMPNPLYAPDGGSTEDTHYQIWQNPQTKYITLRYVAYDEEGELVKELKAGATSYGILTEPKDIVTEPIDEGDVGHSTAVGGGTVYNDGGSYISEAGVIWTKISNPDIADPEEDLRLELWDGITVFRTEDAEGTSGATGLNFISHLHSLQGGEIEYYVRAYARNEIGVGYGGVETFKTLASGPEIYTLKPEVGCDMAKLRGNIESLGVETKYVDRAFFCWDEETFIKDPGICPEEIGTVIDIDTAPHEFSFSKYGLSPNGESYYFKACADNDVEGLRCGEVKEFFTTETGLPSVDTRDDLTTGITSDSVRVSGEVTSDGCSELLERGICYSYSEDPLYNSWDGEEVCNAEEEVCCKKASSSEIGVFSINLDGLEVDTTYSFRAYAKNNEEPGLSHGLRKYFTTEQSAPKVTTKALGEMDIGSSWVISGGEVTNSGGSTVYQRGVCWQLLSSVWDPQSLDPEVNTTNCTDDGPGEGEFASNIPTSEAKLLAELKANTEYKVRAYAINEEMGEGWAENLVIFETGGTATPTVITLDPDDIGEIGGESAMSGGIIQDHGGAEIWTLGICWSSTTDPKPPASGEVSCESESAINSGEFSVEATGLLPGRKYYVQAYAQNEKAYGYGGSEDFNTLPAGAPTGVTTVTVKDSDVDWVVIEGDVESNGGDPSTRRGICYSTDANLSINYKPNGNCLWNDEGEDAEEEGEGVFDIRIEDSRLAWTTYYALAFATNISGGITYGKPPLQFKIQPPCSQYVDGQFVFTPSGQQGVGCTDACYACDEAHHCTARTVDGASAEALGCYDGDTGCTRCDTGACTYYSDNAKHSCGTCSACDASGNCTARTVEGASATALGCALGQEGCRRCDAGTCAYYSDNAKHGCGFCQVCNTSGNCSASAAVGLQTSDCNAQCKACDGSGYCGTPTVIGTAAQSLGCQIVSNKIDCNLCENGGCYNIYNKPGHTYIYGDLGIYCSSLYGNTLYMWGRSSTSPSKGNYTGGNYTTIYTWGPRGTNVISDCNQAGIGNNYEACYYCQNLEWMGYSDWMLSTNSDYQQFNSLKGVLQMDWPKGATILDFLWTSIQSSGTYASDYALALDLPSLPTVNRLKNYHEYIVCVRK